MSKLPRLLAIDCATRPASVAVATPEGPLAELAQEDDARTDAWVGVALEQCLELAGVGAQDLDGIAVCVGPGTFTGIRVGIATALGMAAPLALPVGGVTSLDALATIALRHAPRVAACLDARRDQVYGALYDADQEPDALPLATLWGPVVCTPEEMADALARHGGDALVLGSGAALLAAARGGTGGDAPAGDGAHRAGRNGERPTALAGPLQLAATIGELALRRWPEGGTPVPDWPAPEPVYLRPPDAKPPRNPLLSTGPPGGV